MTEHVEDENVEETEKKKQTNNTVPADLANATADAVQIYAMMDMLGDVFGAIGNAASAVGECAGDIVSGICE